MVYVFSSVSKFTVVTIPQKNSVRNARRHMLESFCIAIVEFLFARLLANVKGCMTEILTLIVALLVNGTFFFASICYYEFIGNNGVRFIFEAIQTVRSRNGKLNFSLKPYKRFVDLSVGCFYIAMVALVYILLTKALPPELTNGTYAYVILILYLITIFYVFAWTFLVMLIVSVITIILNRLTLTLPRLMDKTYLRFTWGEIFESYMFISFSYGLIGLTGIFVTFALMVVGILGAHINFKTCIFSGYIYIAFGSLTALVMLCETVVIAVKNVSTRLSQPD